MIRHGEYFRMTKHCYHSGVVAQGILYIPDCGFELYLLCSGHLTDENYAKLWMTGSSHIKAQVAYIKY